MNKLNSRYLLIIAISAVTIIMPSCRGSKDVAKKPTKQKMEVIKDLVLEGFAFSNLNSKMEFKIFPKEGVSAGMKGNIKIQKDTCMILSLQPFAGIEAVRCKITPDSIYLLSRLHSTYATEGIDALPYSELKPYYLLQSVLTNRVFIPGKVKPEEKDLEKFMTYNGKEGEFISITQNKYNLAFRIDDEQQYDKLTVGTEDVLKALEVNYTRFERANLGVFPHFIEMTTQNEGKNLKMQVYFLSPAFDINTDFSFDIPKRYKKVTIKEMLDKFSNML